MKLMLPSLLLLLFSSSAWACRCDFSAVQALEKNPVSAETAFIAKREELNGKSVLKVEKAWTSVPADFISYLGTDKCAPPTQTGKQYLVLSFNKLDFIQKRGMGFTICDSLLIELSKAEKVLKKIEEKRGKAH